MMYCKKRILIVDDEEDLTWSLSRKLLRDVDYFEIMCANSGDRALEMLSQNRIDLVVTDLRMPEVNGIQLLKEVKENHPDTQIIVMTAYGSVDVKNIIQKYGDIGYIEKPFEINDLRRLIQKVLEISSGQQGEQQ